MEPLPSALRFKPATCECGHVAPSPPVGNKERAVWRSAAARAGGTGTGRRHRHRPECQPGHGHVQREGVRGPSLPPLSLSLLSNSKH